MTAALLDWIDDVERATADLISEGLAQETVLASLAQAWRSSLTAAGAIPPSLRSLYSLPAGWEGRGPGPGGLSGDYPTGLLRATKLSWAAAARGLAIQGAFFPPRFGMDFAAATRHEALARALEACPAPELVPTPAEIVLETDGFRLRRFLSAEASSGEPILVLSSLINRWYVLDFLEGRSFVKALCGFGRPVYLLEGLPPAGAADDRSLPELCAGPLLQAIDHVRVAHQAERIALLGYCMGGTLAAMLTARYPERIARLATVCGPVQFKDGGLFTRWFSPAYLDVEVVADACQRVPAFLVHQPFWWLRPTIKTSQLTRLARSFEQPGQVERFVAGEVWNQDNVDMARGVFRSWVGDLYQQDRLVGGELTMAGEPIAIERIECPTLAVSGTYDAITPAASCEPLLDLVGSRWKRLHRLKTGHVGVLTSPRSLSAHHGELEAWLDAKETA